MNSLIPTCIWAALVGLSGVFFNEGYKVGRGGGRRDLGGVGSGLRDRVDQNKMHSYRKEKNPTATIIITFQDLTNVDMP